MFYSTNTYFKRTFTVAVNPNMVAHICMATPLLFIDTLHFLVPIPKLEPKTTLNKMSSFLVLVLT